MIKRANAHNFKGSVMIYLNDKIRIESLVDGVKYVCVCNDIVNQWLEELTYSDALGFTNDNELVPYIVECAIYKL